MKRISSRAVIIEDGYLYTIYRKRDGKEYYVIPGGGVDEGETLEETVQREIKEELSVDIVVEKYLGKEESDTFIAHYYLCSIKNGKARLGGEEKEKNCANNYYEIYLMNIHDINNYQLLGKEKIIEWIKEI